MERLSLEKASKKLEEYPTLKTILGPKWLERQYRKPEQHFNSLIRWISSSDDYYLLHLSAFEEMITHLVSKVEANERQKIESKIRVNSDRPTFLGTLSEIAVMYFLAKNEIKFHLEVALGVNGTDIDIQAHFDHFAPINIEVYRLALSDKGELASEIAALYSAGYPIFNEDEYKRIVDKVFEKTTKFTTDAITFVAIDLTENPSFGGKDWAPINDLFDEVFTGEHTNHNIPKLDDKLSAQIRPLVDGIIWFQIDYEDKFVINERGICINPGSPHRKLKSIEVFSSLWQNAHLKIT